MKRTRATGLTDYQLEVVNQPPEGLTFLEGPAGAGKTSAGVERLLGLMEQGERGDSILVFAPQRTLAAPYTRALEFPGAIAGGQPAVMTPGGLAKRMVELYWPIAGLAAGFAHPNQPPVFLTLESAQYFMARVAGPLFEAGRFDSLSLDRNRLYSQVIDNLNKAAVVGFPHDEIAQRLISASSGERDQVRVYNDAQECACLFRRYCLENNLLDFSLQVEVFREHLWKPSACREMLEKTYRHITFDNLEEDTPFAFDLLCEWLPRLDSALLIYDSDSGLRRFLGADPELAASLKNICDRKLCFDRSLVQSRDVAAFEAALPFAFRRGVPAGLQPPEREEYLPAIGYPPTRLHFHNEMVDWAASLAAELVNEQGVSPNEIVILAPYMPDSLRFSLADRLESLGISIRSHRPSRSLSEEPPAQCLLTLAALAHPDWGLRPSAYDVTYALIEAIDGLDLVRAQLLTRIVYDPAQFPGRPLSSFEIIQSDIQERITYVLGERYERLRNWLEDYAQGEPDEIDFFFSRLFGEVLSQPGYRFHSNYPAGETAANLVDSAANFRQAVCACPQPTDACTGKDFIQMVAEGVIAATYVRSWQAERGDEVLISPAYTFLLSNRTVEVQIWLDITSRAWGERLEQPLTHPYVLSRWWPAGAKWTDEHELNAEADSLYRLVRGLVRRCRRKIYIGYSTLNEQGYEQQGLLMRIFQRLMSA